MKGMKGFQKGNKEALGHKVLEVVREKIRQAHLGKKRPPFSEEWKKRMRKPKSEATKIKMSFIQSNMSDETKKRMRESAIKRFSMKENHPRWQGGITTYERKLYLNNCRRALRNNAIGFHTEGEWETLKAQYNWTCPSCKKREPKIKLTEDHIIPLSKGGSNNIENIQPLCRSCNCKKHTKIIKY